MLNRSRWLFTALILVLCTAQSQGQMTAADKANHALNTYVDFVNEGIHSLEVLRVRLEFLNRTANSYLLAAEKPPLSFSLADFYQNGAFNGSLVGACAITDAAQSFDINLNTLYKRTNKENAWVPAGSRSSLNTSRDEMMFILIEIYSLSDSLAQYINTKNYVGDKDLTYLYHVLSRIEVLYHDFEAIHDKIAFSVNTSSGKLPEALKELHSLMKDSRAVVRGVRYEAWTHLEEDLEKLSVSITNAEKAMSFRTAEMQKLGLYYQQEGTGYKNMITYAREIQRRALYLKQGGACPLYYKSYGRTYYYYNEQLLTAFNHRKYGLLAYYNRFTGFANLVLAKEIEEVPWFRVIQPSLNASSLASQLEWNATSNIGALAGTSHPLHGAPASHLVFLLDISASMRQSGRLDLLKEGMIRLIQWMRAEDYVSIVVYSDEVRTILEPTSASDKDVIVEAINRILAQSKTNADKGIRQAYRVAEEHLIPEGNNRIIWATDGDFKITSAIANQVKKGNKDQVSLSILLFGKKPVIDRSSPLETLSNDTNGRFTYVQRRDIDRILLEEAAGLHQ